MPINQMMHIDHIRYQLLLERNQENILDNPRMDVLLSLRQVGQP